MNNDTRKATERPHARLRPVRHVHKLEAGTRPGLDKTVRARIQLYRKQFFMMLASILFVYHCFWGQFRGHVLLDFPGPISHINREATTMESAKFIRSKRNFTRRCSGEGRAEPDKARGRARSSLHVLTSMACGEPAARDTRHVLLNYH